MPTNKLAINLHLFTKHTPPHLHLCTHTSTPSPLYTYTPPPDYTLHTYPLTSHFPHHPLSCRQPHFTHTSTSTASLYTHHLHYSAHPHLYTSPSLNVHLPSLYTLLLSLCTLYTLTFILHTSHFTIHTPYVTLYTPPTSHILTLT